MEAKLPKISFIVPVYNVEDFLEDCINSILFQENYTDYELILIDDGSTDNSGIICDKYRTDARVRVIHKKNEGVSVARNLGMQLAKGKYITFVDADDTINSTYIPEDFYSTNITTYADLYVCKEIDLNENGTVSYTRKYSGVNIEKENFLMEMMTCQHISCGPCAKFYRKKLLLDCYFPLGVTLGEDYFFLYYAMKNIKNISIYNRGTYFVKLRKGSAVRCAFSPAKMKLLDVCLDVFLDAKKSYSQAVSKVAMGKYVSSAFHLLLQLPSESSYQKRCLDVIQMYRGDLIFDRRIECKIRFASLLSYISIDFLKLLFKLYKK